VFTSSVLIDCIVSGAQVDLCHMHVSVPHKYTCMPAQLAPAEWARVTVQRLGVEGRVCKHYVLGTFLCMRGTCHTFTYNACLLLLGPLPSLLDTCHSVILDVCFLLLQHWP